jgi:hypothetical protein
MDCSQLDEGFLANNDDLKISFSAKVDEQGQYYKTFYGHNLQTILIS